jgi:hypothetical protein
LKISGWRGSISSRPSPSRISRSSSSIAHQDQATGGVQHQGLHHLQPSLAALGVQLGHQLWRIAARRPGGETDQAEGEGQAEDGAGEIEEIHTLAKAPRCRRCCLES